MLVLRFSIPIKFRLSTSLVAAAHALCRKCNALLDQDAGFVVLAEIMYIAIQVAKERLSWRRCKPQNTGKRPSRRELCRHKRS
jgi:hypothetical protein